MQASTVVMPRRLTGRRELGRVDEWALCGDRQTGSSGLCRRLAVRTKGPSGPVPRLTLAWAYVHADVWAKHALQTGSSAVVHRRHHHRRPGTRAGAVGDDRIQKRAQDRADPETFTHGTSALRQHWFSTGYHTGASPPVRHVLRQHLPGNGHPCTARRWDGRGTG